VAFKNFSLVFQGKRLVNDTRLELVDRRRYGLVGANGCGKSSLLCAIGQRELAVPPHIDIYHLVAEVPVSDLTPMEIVSACDDERVELETESDRLIDAGEGIDDGRLDEIYERLEQLDVNLVEKRAGEILNGLGFTPETMKKAARDFSGGWRMRIALARCLFLSPQILLLDEPTNHLDMESCLWLEERLSRYDSTLVIISHSQDFMNAVCQTIIYMHNTRLRYFKGDYDTFVKTKHEDDLAQQKKYEAEQKKIQDMRLFIEKNSAGKQASQAQSREKELEKMIAGGLTEAVVPEIEVTFAFEPCGKLPPPVMQFENVRFHYPRCEDKVIYEDVNLGFDCDSRVALVGPNGAGKSTLVKLMCDEAVPVSGAVKKHRYLKVAKFTQHSTDMLDLDMCALKWLLKEFPAQYDASDAESRRLAGQHENKLRGRLGSFGIAGTDAVQPMRYLSDGQKSRVCFAHMASCKAHIVLLDEVRTLGNNLPYPPPRARAAVLVVLHCT
jgi:ATP-binding cassette subfamily F protein 2